MSEINDLMEYIEHELRFMEFDKEHRTLKEIIDEILDEKKKNRRIAGG